MKLLTIENIGDTWVSFFVKDTLPREHRMLPPRGSDIDNQPFKINVRVPDDYVLTKSLRALVSLGRLRVELSKEKKETLREELAELNKERAKRLQVEEAQRKPTTTEPETEKQEETPPAEGEGEAAVPAPVDPVITPQPAAQKESAPKRKARKKPTKTTRTAGPASGGSKGSSSSRRPRRSSGRGTRKGTVKRRGPRTNTKK